MFHKFILTKVVHYYIITSSLVFYILFFTNHVLTLSPYPFLLHTRLDLPPSSPLPPLIYPPGPPPSIPVV